MKYKILIEPSVVKDLNSIYNFIEKNDSKTKAKNFLSKLQKQIKTLNQMPQIYRDSYYLKDGKTKDLIYKGYTICYHINSNRVHILSVFRQKNY